MDNNPDGYCLYFDTEAAVNRGLLESRGIDLDRLVVINVVTIEEFRSKALRAVDKYMQMPIEDRKPCMFCVRLFRNAFHRERDKRCIGR